MLWVAALRSIDSRLSSFSTFRKNSSSIFRLSQVKDRRAVSRVGYIFIGVETDSTTLTAVVKFL